MTTQHLHKVNGILRQISQHPQFIKLNTTPLLGAQILYTVLGYATFAMSTSAYLAGDISFLVMMLLNGYSMLSMFTIIHDATHGAVSKYRWLNDMAGTIGAFIYFPGMSTTLYRLLHLRHHQYTGDAELDPDIKFSQGGFIRCMLYALVKDLYWGMWVSRHWRDISAVNRMSFIITTSIFITWYGVWLTSSYAIDFLLVYLIPQRVGYVILVYFFAHAPHPAGIKQSERPFEATEIVTMPLWAGLLITNQDLHPIHHLFPSIPWTRYRKVWALGHNLLAREIPRRHVIEQTYVPAMMRVKIDPLLTVVITEIDEISIDVKRYLLCTGSDAILPAFAPGAHIDVHIKDGLIRQYSLCDLDAKGYVIAVKRDDHGRGGSKTLHQTFNVGKKVKISFPKNNFRLDRDAQHYQLIAAGIGITPLLTMAQYLFSLDKKFTLHIFSRSSEHLPFANALGQSPFKHHIQCHFTANRKLQQYDIKKLIGHGNKEKQLYLCGPSLFMQHIIDQAEGSGWCRQNIHFEEFNRRVIINDISANIVEDKPFELVLTISNKVVTVGAHETIVAAAKRVDIDIPTSCEMGLCGTCVCHVSAGEILHRDCVLSANEHASGQKITACISRAKGNSLSIDR